VKSQNYGGEEVCNAGQHKQPGCLSQNKKNKKKTVFLCHGIVNCQNLSPSCRETETRRELMNPPFPLPLLRKSGSIQLCYFQSPPSLLRHAPT
jgi:hypothetical protein